ncbi:MAG TPA: phosphoenolpyruvate carboxykinase (ATP) [Symbiobacteriaceae bacterium]|nr:phosphoenolpyruvate carboxykinase (ATP) [Symbiobacteriaceae bacterium]
MTASLSLDARLDLEQVHRNLPVAQLVELALQRGEAQLAEGGALQVTTGTYTGRSPKDKFIVQRGAEAVDWGPVNQPIAPERFDGLLTRMLDHLHGRELFVFDGYAGADPDHQLPIRIINEFAWQSLFVRQLFVRPTGELPHPSFTVLCLPTFQAEPERDGTNSECFVIVDFERRMVLIGGTHYAGEIKKSIFSVLNYLLPTEGHLPMHCSANVGARGDVTLFFGLSGTGKTTLSADPTRRLIGDDEHGWTADGIFNMEGGCYAKCIDLSATKEPQIYAAIRFGTVLENVVLDPITRQPDYADGSLTENTRAAYPVDFIPGALIPGVAGPPERIVFLTADASGVLPPIARLTREQALYYFLSGYTSKLAGTERGVTEPQATFSPCFGGPFLPRRAEEYAELLGQKIDAHGVQVYLVNTGWSGGGYGVGRRMSLPYTRAMVTAAIEGALDGVAWAPETHFGLLIPQECPGVPTGLLDPASTWSDPAAYAQEAAKLAGLFVKNFARFGGVAEAIRLAGPRA